MNQCLIQSLAVEFSIRPGLLLAAMKDRASVNRAALEQVKFYSPQLLDITCFSHTIDNVGKHFESVGLPNYGWPCPLTVLQFALLGRLEQGLL